MDVWGRASVGGLVSTTGIFVKYDGNGIMQWKHSFGSSGYDSFRSVIEIQDGGLLIAGYVKGSNGGSS